MKKRRQGVKPTEATCAECGHDILITEDTEGVPRLLDRAGPVYFVDLVTKGCIRTENHMVIHESVCRPR